MPVKIILEKKGSNIPPQQEKTAVVIIGRFQPPTIGHTAIINAAKKAFRKYKYDAIIVCVIAGKETSKDKQKNPLSGESRVYYLENSSYGKGIKYLVAGSAFDAFIKCREMGYEPMCVVGGHFVSGENEENRAEGYKQILDKYFKAKDGDTIDHKTVVLDRDTSAGDVKGVSGSTVRAAVLHDKYEDFREMVAVDSDEIAKKMWNELKDNLGGNDE
jgi:cytidyltransferase-like protein